MADAKQDPTLEFYEEQQFRQPWLIGLLVLMFLATLIGPIAILATAQTRRPHGTAVYGSVLLVLLVEMLVTALVVAFILLIKMITEVRWSGLTVQSCPVIRLRREIPFSEIKQCEARTYSPIGEYGGWGIRHGRSGRAYNISGNRGVQLVLESGERLLIGSQKADELAAAIQRRMEQS